MKAYVPGEHYVSLSLSGTACALNCEFCNRQYLRSMVPAITPESLEKVMKHLYQRGARGFLLSGGFTREGYLMIKEGHLRAVARFRKEFDVVVSMHSGLMPRDLLDIAWESGVDFIDFEVPPSNEYLKRVKGLAEKTVDDYLSKLDEILSYSRDWGVPHLILDSIAAEPEDELRMMREISERRPRLFVALVEIRPSPRNDAGRVLSALRVARSMFREVSLGCMRSPRLKKVLDEEVIKNNLVDRITNPPKQLIRRHKLPLVWACCSIPDSKEHLFPSCKWVNGEPRGKCV